MARALQVIHLGRVRYDEAIEKMKARAVQRTAGEVIDALFLLEHEPVFTLGRNADAANILVDRGFLASQGIEVAETGRGGDVTYHGPGQIVGYPVLDLKPDRKDVRKYVSNLEKVMIQVSQRYALQAGRQDGLIGAWIQGSRKIGAIGVRLSKWITTHGFAFNVAPNMDHFQLIVPCGIQHKGVTSLSKELGRTISMEEAYRAVEEEFRAVFEYPALAP